MILGFQNEFEASRKVEKHKEVTSGDGLSCLGFGIDLLPMYHRRIIYRSNQQFLKDIGITDW